MFKIGFANHLSDYVFLIAKIYSKSKNGFFGIFLVSVGLMIFYDGICRFVLKSRIIRLWIHHGNQYIASFLASDYWLVDVRSMLTIYIQRSEKHGIIVGIIGLFPFLVDLVLQALLRVS